jgi:DNA-binding NarL/FixJ family response regulator
VTDQIRILSVDDHPLVREGIATVINGQPDMQVVAQACSGCEAIQRFGEHKPDVTLMDLRLPDMSGIDAMVAIRSKFLRLVSSFLRRLRVMRKFSAR